MMKLYGAPPTRALRVLWLLNELGVEYEMLPVDVLKGETKSQELRTLNPAAKVPVLVDGSVMLTESAAIQLYLADKIPRRDLSRRRWRIDPKCIGSSGFEKLGRQRRCLSARQGRHRTAIVKLRDLRSS